jgi:hypothetical protein
LYLKDYTYINSADFIYKDCDGYLIPEEDMSDIIQPSSIESLLDSKISQSEVVKSYIDSTSLTLKEKLEMQHDLNAQTGLRMDVYSN